MKKRSAVLVVDDEKEFCDFLVERLNRRGYQVVGLTNGTQALDELKVQTFDVAIFDLKMPDLNGLELLRKARELQPDLQVLILTGYGTIETAVEAMKLGAYDYLTKPCNLKELEIVLEKALEKKSIITRNAGLMRALWPEGGAVIVGQSPAIRKVLELIQKVADSEVPVLIQGETGTGKELVARNLHAWSRRAGQPFIAVNSGALPRELLESELFGYVKGAFTGALTDKPGLVEAAEGGTLFLDEVGEMDPALQVKLLRFLETGEFRRVGDNRLRSVDVRVVAATNRCIEKEVREGRFREDLYYRLNVITIHLPPLRERKEDIPCLVQYFLRRFSPHKEPPPVSKEAMEALLAYDYPGNVRELANLIERGLLLAGDGPIRPEHLFYGWDTSRIGDQGLRSLEEVEKEHILRVLKATGGNKTRAAQILGISLRNLYRKIAEYGLGN